MWNLEVKTYRAINQPRQGQEVIIQLCCKGLIQFKQKEQQCRIKTKKIKAKSEKDSSEIRQDIMHFFFKARKAVWHNMIWLTTNSWDMRQCWHHPSPYSKQAITTPLTFTNSYSVPHWVPFSDSFTTYH